MNEQGDNGYRLPLRKRGPNDLVFQPHQHSSFSDGLGTPEELVNEALRVGVNVLAITDHDSVNGAIEAWNYAERYKLTNLTNQQDHFEVIIGEEVSTNEGHLLLLGVEQSVVCGLSPEETAQAGLEQDALVVIPHPGFTQADGMTWEQTDSLIKKQLAHGVELYNGAQQTLTHMANVAENFPGGKHLSERLMRGGDINREAMRQHVALRRNDYAVLGGHDNHLPSGIEKVTTLFPQGMTVFDAVRDKQTDASTNFVPEFWGPHMFLRQNALSERLKNDRQNNRNGIMCVTIYEQQE